MLLWMIDSSRRGSNLLLFVACEVLIEELNQKRNALVSATASQ
jgi:hypothetical protein